MPFALPQTVGCAQATKPAAGLAVEHLAQGSPERVYLELINEIRTGHVEEAMKRLTPVPKRFEAMVRVQIQNFAAAETLRPIIREKYGELGAEGYETGFYYESGLKTLQSQIDGDVAHLTIIPGEDDEREKTAIVLHRIDGRWRVNWKNYSDVYTTDDYTADITDEEIRRSVEVEPKFKEIIKQVKARIIAGEFKGPAEIRSAIFSAGMSDGQKK